jgi:ketosteroid isomerase-like protein
MAESKADLLVPVYESWGRGDWTPQFDVYDPEMEWGFSEDFIESGMRSEIGQKSSRLRAWLSQWDHWRCVAERYIESGDQVVVLARYIGRGKSSRAPVETLGAHVWTMRGGKAVKLEVFSNRESALAATGIGAPDYPSASERTTAS